LNPSPRLRSSALRRDEAALVTARAAPEPSSPSRHVLSELPARVVIFLSAVGRDGALQAALARGGYTAEDHREGWRLLEAACAFTEAADPNARTAAQDTAAELAAWWSTHSTRLKTAITRLQPEHGDLFAGIEAYDETSAILAVATLLARIEQKERGKATALLDTLARRRLDARARSATRARASVAGGWRDCDHGAGPRVARKELTALYQWYRDWATTARSVLGRKSSQIALGLATRARRDGARAEVEE
jgi:hypothetical protein